MKLKTIMYMIFFISSADLTFAKVTPERLKAWLELGKLRQKMDENVKKYNNLEAELKQETNEILEQGIDAGDAMAEQDPYAALFMYYDLRKLKDTTIQKSLDIQTINKKFQDLSDYITKTIKELEAIRRKHLQFP